MRYDMKIGLLGFVAFFATTGCQASFKAGGGSETPNTYNNNPPPPRYNNGPYNNNNNGQSAPRAAPLPPNPHGGTTYVPPGQYNPPPSSGNRYTLPGGDSVPIISSPNSFGNGSATSDSLRGLVYALSTNTSRLPDLSSLRPIGVVYARTLDVPQRDFREGFPGIDNGRNEWFAIRFEGNFNVARTAPYSFRLRTDDGSNLYIDDIKQIDNDGLHGPGGGARIVNLNAGTHRIRVDYFQGPGPSAALQLFTSEVNRPERPFTTSF